MIQQQKWCQFVAQTENGQTIKVFQSGAVIGQVQAHHFNDAILRNGITLFLASDKQGGHHCQCQWNFQANIGPYAPRTVNLNRATNLGNVGLDNVHANTPARQVGDDALGGEPWQKDVFKQLHVRQSQRTLSCQKFLLDRFLTDQFKINAATIVNNLNHNHAIFMTGF